MFHLLKGLPRIHSPGVDDVNTILAITPRGYCGIRIKMKGSALHTALHWEHPFRSSDLLVFNFPVCIH